MTTATDTKVCTGCQQAKPRDAFYKKSGSPNGALMSQCKECKKATSRREYKARNGPGDDGSGPVTETATDTTVQGVGADPQSNEKATDQTTTAGCDGSPESNGQRPHGDDWPDTIAKDHREQLIASGITPEHAVARGYETVRDTRRLEALGFVKAACKCVPGLLIPMLRIDGSTWGYQYRPDVPRWLSGKPVKYETPYQQRNGIDFPPTMADLIADPTVPLWVTEGSKKADCGAHYQLCIVALSGVWNWRGTNNMGGKTAVGDWNEIALNGRRIVLAFDGDVARKRSAAKALCALADFLKSRGASVEYLHLPDTDEKTGLDDFLVAGHTAADLFTLVKPNPPPLRERPPDDPASSHPPSDTATPQQSWSGVLPRVAVLRSILDRIGEEVRLRGLVGEENLAKTLYLAMTSRLLDKQVSVGVKGHSSSGKSYTVETVTRFFPPQAFLEFTAMSERALVYSPEQYAHRTIVIYEVTAMRENVEDDLTSYFIRSLLSEGRIVYDVTTKDRHGNFTTRRVVKEGPTNLIFTTTKTKVHAENETRILSLVTDDSTEQTARVLLEIADEATGGNDLDELIDFQLWLASEHAEHRVTIPYARELARLVPPVAVRLRRDFGAVLSLIRAHAMLHQLSRSRDDQGRIVATVADYAVVRELVADVITEGIGATVSETVRETVAAVAAVAPTLSGGASVRAVAAHLKIDKSNAGRRLRVAADGGYIKNLETRRGMASRWMTDDPLPDQTAVLPTAAQLRNSSQPVDQECCGVAPRDQGRENEAPPGADGAQPSSPKGD